MQIEQIKTIFLKSSSWQERYKNLILLAKQDNHYPEALEDESHQIMDCENKMWIAKIQNEQTSYFIGKSDAKMMQGLMIIIATYANEMLKNDQFDAQKIIPFLQELNIWNDFSASKQIGIRTIIKKMNDFSA